jgi:FkbM family methyltransferase
MSTKRWNRRQAASCLPAWMKAPFRARRVGFRTPEISASAAFSADDDGPFVIIDRRVRLRFCDEDGGDVALYLRDNGESVEEMASFLSIASSAYLLFDVGAAKGVFSEIFCLLDPASQAVAFEPSPALADSAAALAVINGCQSRLHLRRCAVGVKAGSHMKYCSERRACSSSESLPSVSSFPLTCLNAAASSREVFSPSWNHTATKSGRAPATRFVLPRLPVR